MQTRWVAYCPDAQVHWDSAREAPKCADPSHEHQQFEVHVHRSEVVLPDGTRVTAVSFDPFDRYTRESQPDFGLYLDQAWQPPWSRGHVEWPDFGVPRRRDELMTALQVVLDRARTGERVELGCMGGHGRTGTALACLAVLGGGEIRDGDPVAWVRETYCTASVETPEQEAFVRSFAQLMDPGVHQAS